MDVRKTSVRQSKCVRKLFVSGRELELPGGDVENNMLEVPELNPKKNTFSFTLSGYSKLKRAGLKFKCDPFYSPGGHRLHAVVSCNGSSNAKGTHLSVRIEALWSARSCELQWPLLGTVSVTLLNQTSNSCQHQHTQTANLMTSQPLGLMNPTAARLDHFISHQELSQGAGSNTLYLLHDTLIFQVEVDMSKDSFPIIMLDSVLCQMKYLRDGGGEIFEFPIPNYSAEEKYSSEFSARNGSIIKADLSSNNNYLSVAVEVYKSSDHAYTGIVLVELVNLLEDRNHHTRVLPRVGRDHASSSRVNMSHKNFIHWRELPRTIKMDGCTSYLEKDFLMLRIILFTEEEGSEEDDTTFDQDHMV